jgi:hypothetical protein
MAPGRTLRILLALLLLSAQHAALSHAVSHLNERGLPDEQKLLCDQHDALGTVAGALDCTHPPLAAVAPPVPVSFIANLPSASTPGLAPSSRGPPSLL